MAIPEMTLNPTRTATRFALSALIFTLGLTSCRYLESSTPEPLPISRRLTWDGLAPLQYTAIPMVGTDSQSSGPIGIHEFAFGGPDSVLVRLEEYSNAYLAYSDFQNLASSAEMSEGFYHRGGDLAFYHGTYSGELRFPHGGMMLSQTFKEKLSFAGEPLFLAPPEFTSFPLLGRIPHSERVFASHFLGRLWQGPVFSVSYRCHGDTATAFRANGQDTLLVNAWLQEWNGRIDASEQGSQVRFQGWDEFKRPLVFWVFPEAIIGVEGCSDGELALDYTRKLEKMREMWPEP